MNRISLGLELTASLLLFFGAPRRAAAECRSLGFDASGNPQFDCSGPAVGSGTGSSSQPAAGAHGHVAPTNPFAKPSTAPAGRAPAALQVPVLRVPSAPPPPGDNPADPAVKSASKAPPAYLAAHAPRPAEAESPCRAYDICDNAGGFDPDIERKYWNAYLKERVKSLMKTRNEPTALGTFVETTELDPWKSSKALDESLGGTGLIAGGVAGGLGQYATDPSQKYKQEDRRDTSARFIYDIHLNWSGILGEVLSGNPRINMAVNGAGVSGGIRFGGPPKQ